MGKNFRNFAIIAHVDHGKTSLIDAMFSETLGLRDSQISERAMDSNDLEKERGITILSKCTSFIYEGYDFNVVDTPGHADFGGEVERVMGMVDGVLLLVDAAEGPMPQTKFVVSKALAQGLKPIVVINKIDRPDRRPDEVLDEVFDLFVSLEANEDQLDFPVVYSSAKEGWAVEDYHQEGKNLEALFKCIIENVPAPREGQADKAIKFLASTLDMDPFLGRILTGRVRSGTIRVGANLKALSSKGEEIERSRITKILKASGVNKVIIDEAEAGDIVSIAGFPKASVSDTICDYEVEEPLESLPIDPPTISMTFSVNDSPLAGLEGKKLTSSVIKERLLKEQEGNISIVIQELDTKEAFEVAGRGELQLGVLIENMRREGFELSVGPPKVLFRKDPETGQKLEPMEEALVDVDEEFIGAVVEKIGQRKGELIDMNSFPGGKVRAKFKVPTRGLIGYRSEFLTDTRGTGMLFRLFLGYEPYRGEFQVRKNGALISMENGKSTAYALWNLEDRGVMFIGPGDEVYEGMILGENSRPNDLEINVIKGKKLSNVRAAGKDESIRLTPPRKMTLEDALSYIQSDEILEVTPTKFRIRKKYLDSNVRKRMQREGKV